MAMDNGPHIQDVLLQFRAGRMFLEGTRVVPDARKGLVQITRDVEGLVHLQWLDRSRGTVTTVEDANSLQLSSDTCFLETEFIPDAQDQIIFPDEATFEKVNQSPDRVYILKFNSDSRKLFFWMQEPDADGDAGICTAVNVYINQPLGFAGEDEPEASIPLPVSERSEDTAEDEISSRAGNLHDGNLASELASEATSALPPPFLSLSDQQRTLRTKLASEATSESDRPLSSSEEQQRDLARTTSPLVGEAASSLPVQLADLQRILRSIQPGGTVEDPDGGFGLADILKSDLILPLIETMGLEQQLASFLPEGSQTREDLIELLQSPPFRQQVDTFTHVLRTGQVDLSQFGVDPSKYNFTVLSFLEALNDSVTRAAESGEAGSAGSPSQRGHNDDDAMDES